MSRELDELRYRAEEMMRRHAGSRSSRDAAKRSFERGVRALFIRLRRAGVTFVGLMAALVVYSIAVGGVNFFIFLAAMVTIALAAFLVMFFPVRERGRREMREAQVVDGGTAVRLDRLAAQTEDWLLERCRALPHQASEPLDRIVFRLRDLQPSLATVPSDSHLGGEAQRLVGKHLPSLVTTYLNLPPAERGHFSESNERLAESLGIVADQMDDLCERIADERRMGFETERRFIESRYSDDERLRLDRHP